jgi:hypothetical protein
MASVLEDDPEQLNPAWQFPVYIEQVQRLHLHLYSDYCRRAQSALDRIGEEPDCPYHDETNAQLALRYLRLALANFDPPVSGVALRQVRRDKILKLFDCCQERVRELLRGWGEAQLNVEDLRRNLSLAGSLMEMICLMVEKADLAINPTEGVVDTISWMIDYAGSVAGDAEMRERDEDVTIGVRLANIELEELGMPIVNRLSEVHAVLERHRTTSPAARIREV